LSYLLESLSLAYPERLRQLFFVLRRCGRGNFNDKTSSLALLALDPNMPIVHLDDLPNDVKPEPKPADPAFRTDPLKTPEYALLVFFRDSLAMVLNHETRDRARFRDRDIDRLARGVLHGIGDQIDHYLLH